MSRRATALLLACACVPAADAPGTSATDTIITTSIATTGTTATTSAAPTTTTATSTSEALTSGGVTFIQPPDGGGSKECDLFEQDCPEGMKCSPHSADGDNAWETLKCVDVVPAPAGFHEPCQLLGVPASGEDTCDEGLMCWFTQSDTGVGICLPHCTGSPDAPVCAPGSRCSSTFPGEDILSLCLPSCDPLAQDCPNGGPCTPWDEEFWGCYSDDSGDEGQAFDPCVHVRACDPGLTCAEPELADECDPRANGCCLPYCDLDLPNTCPGQGQACVAWYVPGQAPPGLEDVGLCALP
ncbi:hypothetical protein [Nannocystis punicea]|uniref:Uncharacterized protein n=1 Tax=Nannocystis punicea TaxID=2995304 RepID=A0ABY7HJB5_9BACT|nr:hypothetical protein [Nannocystis poenicansa]WAS99034.1 hypothetical protein O0S08_23135 [Nannocystis poenicansa]